jgi:hypothetical protein
MRRFVPPALAGALEVILVVWLLAGGSPQSEVLIYVAVGTPLTLFLLVRALADPDRTSRRSWPSLLLGATVVPVLVVVLHGVFLAAGYGLVAPLADPARRLWEELRADPDLLRALTSGWSLGFLIEIAVVAPLAEETIKPLAALVRRPRTERDAFLFGAAAGTGFAMIENVAYAGGWMWGPVDNWLPVAVMRMLGAAVHIFGAAIITWGAYQLRDGAPGRWRRCGLAYLAALTGHGLWNGSIAVTGIVFAERAAGGLRGTGDAFAWGVALLVDLAVLGALLAGALLVVAHRIGTNRTPIPVAGGDSGASSGTIAAWSVVTSSTLIPVSILVLVYPHLVAL